MSNTKISFDAARYCRNNAGRMGKWMDGEDIAGMIADEVERLRAELAALKDAFAPLVLACEEADNSEELCENVEGQLIYNARAALDALAALVGEG